MNTEKKHKHVETHVEDTSTNSAAGDRVNNLPDACECGKSTFCGCGAQGNNAHDSAVNQDARHMPACNSHSSARYETTEQSSRHPTEQCAENTTGAFTENTDEPAAGVTTHENDSKVDDNATDNLPATHPLEAENKRLADEMLRMRAEMENSKKRLHRLFEEKADEKNKQLLLDIITLLDNFNRAMSAGESAQANENNNSGAVIEGIKMMEGQFLQTLESKWGLKQYDSVNMGFDPSLHEAMMKENSLDVKEETVTEEFMKGYMLNEKVLRPAKVKVSVPELPSA